MSIFLEMIVEVIIREKVCPNLNGWGAMAVSTPMHPVPLPLPTQQP
jgi:hypothetical protein